MTAQLPAVRAERTTDVVTVGEVMAMLRATDGEPLRAARDFRRDVAGAEGNVAVGLARLGHRVTLATRVGDDTLGAAVLAAYRAEGIDVRAVVDPVRPTGLMIRDVHAERPITVGYYRAGSAASALSIDDVPLDVVAGAGVLHLTGITTVLGDDAWAATIATADAAREAGAIVTFDPNLRRRLASVTESVQRWLPLVERADVVLAGADEAVALSGGGGAGAIADWFHRRGVGVVIVKDGARGAWASADGETVTAPALAVRAVDPVGAGDAFAAGLISAALDADGPTDLASAMRRASAVAAASVQYAGDIAGLPTRAEIDSSAAADGGDVRR